MEAKNVDVQNHQFNLSRIVEMLRNNSLKYIPNSVVSSLDKSRVIENIFLRMPLLSGVFVQNGPAYRAILGKEVLETLYSFVIQGEMKLEGLEFFPELNGLKYSELELRWKRYILESIWNVSVVRDNNTANNIVKRYLAMYEKEN